MTDAAVTTTRGASRFWPRFIVAGFVLVLIALVTVLLVTDKAHFGWLVGWACLPAVTSGVLVWR